MSADDLILGTARRAPEVVVDRLLRLADYGTRRALRVPRAVHDGLAGAVHGSMGLASRSLAGGLATIGDRRQEDPLRLATRMRVRAAGLDVPLERGPLAAAYPRASERIVVFVHGPGGHEEQWDLRRHELGGTYGTRLEAHAGWTAVYLRLDTGLPVSENGVALTALLQRLVEAWPVPVRRLALVGHSTGGLVIRAGCSVATDHDDPWTTRLSDVVTLGSILDHRSQGVRDLEQALPELPRMPRVRYRLVTAAPGGPGAVLLGGLLSRRGSSTATRTVMRLFPDAEVLQLPLSDHCSLLNHPDVVHALQRWLA